MNNMPLRAAMPLPAMMATGVAKPKAQGQEITSTEIACSKAISVMTPLHSQPINVPMESTIIAGTKMDDTLSAKRDTGALPTDAAITKSTICAKAVCSPT